jgi:predicted phage terminase large subunit-like protein
MQRLHMDDLTGFVTAQSEDWTVLTLPAIAEADEWVQEADDLYHRFTAGEALQPEREPLEELERLRRQLGSDLFAAQYQQRPVPESGVIIKRDWVRRYKTLPPCTARTRIEQSWDTAAKVGPENDWSVCSTWQVEGEMYYLVDVTRGRFEFPALKAKALALAQQYSPTRILIEDVGTGTALIQELRKAGRVAIPVRAEQDKITRMAIQSAKFEAGMVYLPEAAPWLSVFEEELFAFPSSKYFDQVDTVSQILGHQRGITMIDCL